MTTALVLSLVGLLSAPADVDAFFKDFTAKRADIQLLQADLEERTYEFGEVSKRTGRVLFGKPRRIIFRFQSDEPVLMVDDNQVYEYDPLEKQLQIFDIDDSPESSIFFLGFDGDPGTLREAYDISLFTVESDEGTHRLVIRPFKENIDTAAFQEVTIYLRDEDYLPFRLDIKLDDTTKTVTEFSNYQINQPVDPSATQLRIPAETRVLENGEVALREVPAGGLLMPPAPLEVPTPGVGVPAESSAASPPAVAEDKVQVEALPAP